MPNGEAVAANRTVDARPPSRVTSFGTDQEKANIGPVHSLALETAILALPAVGFSSHWTSPG